MVSAIIVAAGKGIRMNGKVRKQYLMLAGHPILSRTLWVFNACSAIDCIVVAVPEEDLDFCHERIITPLNLQKELRLVAGGAVRRDSVYNGILAIEDKGGTVVIHDGVRPLVHPELLTACIEGVTETGACSLGLPAFETLKRVNSSGYIHATLDRETIWMAQTPQAFEYSLIREAHEAGKGKGGLSTDDALLVERLGKKVKMIRGSRFNIKITTPEDLAIAEAMLQTSATEFPDSPFISPLISS
ncbi:MAG TPA: 2-C-methyl-D-erythritol 4-phosphate cytidylyltransferase [Desulfobacterales bacterium]|nr:2-C-methyl-D-erythritol 4-phosphate cytidylyltransferase [Desulfobacterales bacterium]